MSYHGPINTAGHPTEDTFDAKADLERRAGAVLGKLFKPVVSAIPGVPPPPPPSILGTQVGGSHYTDCAIQPIEYIWANKLGFSEGNVVKYITRWRAKGGIKDLEKAKHHIALLIEHAQKEGLK